MINKISHSLQAAVADVHDGATVMIGGFGTAGMPSELIDALQKLAGVPLIDAMGARRGLPSRTRPARMK